MLHKFNNRKLDELGQPVARINARHSTEAAKTIDPDELYGSERCIFLAKSAKVVLTLNLWQSVGLCSGVTGTVADLKYEESHKLPTLPIAVVVSFPDYTGPPVIETLHTLVPVCPDSASSTTLGTTHKRQQLPMILARALTIHKSQGLTLELAWLDLGKSERVTGLSYVLQ